MQSITEGGVEKTVPVKICLPVSGLTAKKDPCANVFCISQNEVCIDGKCVLKTGMKKITGEGKTEESTGSSKFNPAQRYSRCKNCMEPVESSNTKIDY